MPFIEIMFCGLATSIFPFSWYLGRTQKAGAGERGGRSAPLQGHQRRSLPVTASARSAFATPRLFGDPPLASPCPPEGLPGTLLPVAECSGYHQVQSCIIKLPWLFASETFTIPCSAGKDDCSKPKLGINYTTTLHFSSTKENCVARAAQAPPSQRPPLRGLLWKASQTA